MGVGVAGMANTSEELRRELGELRVAINETKQSAGTLDGDLHLLRVDHQELQRDLDELRLVYERAGGEVRGQSEDHVKDIHDLRSEAELLVNSLRESSLFGRYAQDADEQGRIASRWRGFAILFLLGAAVLEAYLVAGPPGLSGVTAAVPIFPVVLLFLYASVESRNHRRVEAHRRRIYLRMAAIETYTKRKENGAGRKQLQEILERFIERHFVEPDLDPVRVDDIPRTGLITIVRPGRL
jgi:hypothetical protein